MSAPSPRALAGFVSSALAEQAGCVVVPAPALEPLAVLRSARKSDAWLLERGEPGELPEVVLGLGEADARALAARGGASLEALLARSAGLTRVVHPDVEPMLASRLPLVVLGHAFSTGAGVEEPWAGHGDGRAVLPRWTYLRVGERAALAHVSCEPVTPGRAAVLAAELEAILTAPPAPVPRRRGRVRLEASDGASFQDRVERAREAIGAGTVTKVVCSRRVSVSADHDLGAEEVLARLPAAALRFLVRRGASALIGASPERLFRKDGARVCTEALAGTRAGGSPTSDRALLASTKDLTEHAPVVEAIVTRLTALGADVELERAPQLKQAANVVHLRTAIEARVPGSVGAPALLDALHPTPAVGGAPRLEAESFIRANEPPRGWYSGPLGWIDARGDADIHVMLRCALVRGARAWVFAGGGIVASSEAAAELAETELKMAPMLRALGVEPAIERTAEPRGPDSRLERANDARGEVRAETRSAETRA